MKPTKSQQKQANMQKNAAIGVIVIVALIALYYGAKAVARNIKKAEFDKNPADDPVRLAQEYRLAINPSGMSWLKAVDGTDEESIMTLARSTKGQLDEVQKMYKNKFGTTLTDDLRDELSSDEYQKWFDIVT